MRTSALLAQKTLDFSKFMVFFRNFGFFEIYGMSERTREGERGIEPVQTFFGQGKRGSIFRDFVWRWYGEVKQILVTMLHCAASRTVLRSVRCSFGVRKS